MTERTTKVAPKICLRLSITPSSPRMVVAVAMAVAVMKRISAQRDMVISSYMEYPILYIRHRFLSGFKKINQP